MTLDPSARWETASLWAHSLAPFQSTERPAADGRWEVVVVGGGVAGLVAANVLTRSGLQVLVLERHGIGGVTTRGSTGKLTALQGELLPEIERHRGKDAVAGYAAAAVAGVEGLRTLIEALGISCSLTEVSDHTFATEVPATERARQVFEVAQAAGLPVSWVEDCELPFPITGAVRLGGQAQLDPGALCAGLAAALPAGHVMEHTAVTGVSEGRDEVEIELASGDTISADHVIIATLGPIHDPALLSTRCEARRSYAIAAPLESPPTDTYISVDSASRSIRSATIEGRPAVVVGGAGHVVGELGGRSSEVRWQELERYAIDSLGAGPAEHRWVAHDLLPSDSMPFIGRVAPGAHRRWVISGFQKWGFSTSWVAADLLLGELEGSPRAVADLFDPRRLAPSFTAKLAQDGARAMRHLLVDRLVDLQPGRRRRPRCSHLGCVLDFDEAEESWDCPCHGSRYDADGRVICGPASKDIAPPGI